MKHMHSRNDFRLSRTYDNIQKQTQHVVDTRKTYENI